MKNRSRTPNKHRVEAVSMAGKAHLTKRELEILRCFSQGMNSAAVAKRLSISKATVRNHGQRILEKLGVHTRVAALFRAYARGLIPLPSPDE